MNCPDCLRGLHDLCLECQCCTIISSPVGESFSEPKNRVGRPTKEDGDITDKHSTGRKRAAELYPLFPDQSCDWRGRANCGGGKHPIIGCVKGFQEHRHHGPDKNTLNNGQGNVSRICTSCHNIWHAQNDKDYDPTIMADPRPATTTELMDRQLKVRYCA